MLENVFVYGTLKDKKVQKEIIRRTIDDYTIDVLENYNFSEVNIDGEIYHIISPNKNFSVGGYIIQVTEEELRFIDEYEGTVYKREKVRLVSGKEVWAYVKA